MARIFPPSGTQQAYQTDNLAQIAAAANTSVPEIIRQATLHEINRLETVAETLTLVGFLLHCKVLGGHEVVTVRGARFQWVSGSVTQGTQAAHCLPGWLNFNSIEIHEMSEWTPENLQSKGLKALPFSAKMRNLGGRIDVLTKVINTTDSSLEKMSSERGLKSALRRATNLLVENQFKRRKEHIRVIAELVREVMANYRQTAIYACEERVDFYNASVPNAPNPQARQSLQLRTLVAQTYLKVLQDRSVSPECTSKTGFAGMVKEVLIQG